jgi:hypothetical protein
MITVFEELRAAREARGMSLDDIARQTLINIQFLEALEQGDITILPATYVRAFLREFAACVGLDPVYVMQRFDNVIPAPAVTPTPGAATALSPPAAPTGNAAAPVSTATALPVLPAAQAGQTAPPVSTATSSPVSPAAPAALSPGYQTPATVFTGQPVEPQHTETDRAELSPFWSRPWVRSAVTTVVVLGGIAIIAYFARQTSTTTPPTEIPFGTMLQENRARLSPPDTTTATVLPQAVSARDSLVLRASTSDSVWIQMTVDALPPTDHLLPPNANRTWKARDRFMVTLGNAGGVSFRLNARDLGALGKRGAVLRDIELTRETMTSPVRTEAQP